MVSSAVDRRDPGHRHIFLTDLGSGLLQVEMTSLREEDAGEYGCVVEADAGPQIVHRVSLEVLPEGESPTPHRQHHRTSDLPSPLPPAAPGSLRVRGLLGERTWEETSF